MIHSTSCKGLSTGETSRALWTDSAHSKFVLFYFIELYTHQYIYELLYRAVVQDRTAVNTSPHYLLKSLPLTAFDSLQGLVFTADSTAVSRTVVSYKFKMMNVAHHL